MTKSHTPLEEATLKSIKEELWKIPNDTGKWFPKKIHDWIYEHAKRLGVPETYLSVPLLITASHLSMHTKIQVDSEHLEESILYGIVGGDSGTNKSGALKIFSEIIDKIRSPLMFDTGTSDGLRLALLRNNRCVISMNDEFSTFLENLDKTSGGIERSRVLNLHNALPWGKWTQTHGISTIQDPRFTLFGFSQVENLIEFGRRNLTDGFFQCFICAVPKEVFIYRKEQKQALTNISQVIDLEEVFKILYETCKDKDMILKLDEEADAEYDKFYDEGVDFRRNNIDNKNEKSTVSKARSMAIRIAGIIALLRNSLEIHLENQDAPSDTQTIIESQSLLEELPILAMTNPLTPTSITPVPCSTASVNLEQGPVINKEDFVMAMEITKFSISNSLTVMRKEGNKEKQEKIPVPEPSEITMEYLIHNVTHVRNILKADEVKINDITRMKNYPNGKGGRVPAVKFVKGMEQNGLGKFSHESDSFKRFHPDNEDCPSRDDVRRKWQRFCIE